LNALTAQSKYSGGALNSRGAGSSRSLRIRPVAAALLSAAMWCSAALGQTELGQTIATIPSKQGELLVQNGTNKEAWLVAGDERVSLPAEEALRIAGWIKEGKTGHYGDTGPVRVRRESGILVVTLGSAKTGTKELQLEDAGAVQLAAALASVHQNVSEAGK
jgi:hypothetical protein